MTRHHVDRAEPVDRDDLRAVNAELLRTTGELIESLTRLVATMRLLVQENHRLRQERTHELRHRPPNAPGHR